MQKEGNLAIKILCDTLSNALLKSSSKTSQGLLAFKWSAIIASHGNRLVGVKRFGKKPCSSSYIWLLLIRKSHNCSTTMRSSTLLATAVKLIGM